jgi:hypothetical protein
MIGHDKWIVRKDTDRLLPPVQDLERGFATLKKILRTKQIKCYFTGPYGKKMIYPEGTLALKKFWNKFDENNYAKSDAALRIFGADGGLAMEGRPWDSPESMCMICMKNIAISNTRISMRGKFQLPVYCEIDN